MNQKSKYFYTAIAITHALLSSGSASAQAKTLKITKTKIVFVSDAPAETIKGVSKKASGSLQFDPNDLKTAQGKVSVAVDSLNTGLELRDEHLRSHTWLDAKKFPQASFEIERISGAEKLAVGKATTVKVHGKFTIHGKTKPVTAVGKVKWDGSSLQGKAKFKIKLSAHGVDIPAIVKLKVSDEIEIIVSLKAS